MVVRDQRVLAQRTSREATAVSALPVITTMTRGLWAGECLTIAGIFKVTTGATK